MEDKVLEIIEFDPNVTDEQIAEALGITVKQVEQIIKKLEI
jgi:transcription initiation factor IIE alpha subunit